MEQIPPVTLPPPGEYRLRLPGAAHPINLTITRTDRGATLVYAGRRWVGCLTVGGKFDGRPWARLALERVAAHAQRLHRCGDCGRELTDPASIARGVGPDCWEARRSA
jgi:hypothetical protein